MDTARAWHDLALDCIPMTVDERGGQDLPMPDNRIALYGPPKVHNPVRVQRDCGLDDLI